jgi:hypothetical protein
MVRFPAPVKHSFSQPLDWPVIVALALALVTVSS